MGALHEGHLSLVRASRQACDVTVATIFVNPAQFGPHEDLDQYPRTLDEDLAALGDLNVDFVFAPSTKELYPDGFSTLVEPPAVARPFEGQYRPGHFRGVATIVLKLFNIIPADFAFFGQKDFQQARVIQDMVRDLNVPTTVHVCPTVRDPDGLALSSRNRYLSPAEREQALSLSKCLDYAEHEVLRGRTDLRPIVAGMRNTLEAAGIEKIDYVDIADAQTLEPVMTLQHSAVALVAAHVGATRLIDNRILSHG
jgi:pantoate--beta-alanine ligase